MRYRLLALIAVGCVLAAAESSLAQYNANNRYKYPPPVDHSGSAKAAKQVADAQTQLKKATDEFGDIRATLRSEMEEGPEWRGAQATLKQAQSDYATAKGAVLARLSANKDYAAARDRKAAAEAARDAVLSDDGGVNPVKLADAALAVFDAAQAVTAIETAALNDDARASEAKRLLAQAADRVAALNKQFEETLKEAPKYKAARKAVDDDQQKLAAAQTALATAVDKEARAERDRQNRINDIERRRAADARRRLIR